MSRFIHHHLGIDGMAHIGGRAGGGVLVQGRSLARPSQAALRDGTSRYRAPTSPSASASVSPSDHHETARSSVHLGARPVGRRSAMRATHVGAGGWAFVVLTPLPKQKCSRRTFAVNSRPGSLVARAGSLHGQLAVAG